MTRCAGSIESHTLLGPHERLPLFPPDGAKPPVPLAETHPPEPQPSSISSAERRQLTVMMCELVGSAALSRLDPEELREVIGAYRRVVAAIVAGFDGFVGKYMGEHIGECVLVYFGYPTAQENDAERAVRAALAIGALSDHHNKNVNKGAPEPSARIGLDCGLLVVNSTGEVFGKPPKVAACALTAAEQGAVSSPPTCCARYPAFLSRKSAARANSLVCSNLRTCSASCAPAVADGPTSAPEGPAASQSRQAGAAITDAHLRAGVT